MAAETLASRETTAVDDPRSVGCLCKRGVQLPDVVPVGTPEENLPVSLQIQAVGRLLGP